MPGSSNGPDNSQGSPSPAGARTRLPRARVNLPYREFALHDDPGLVRDPSQHSLSVEVTAASGSKGRHRRRVAAWLRAPRISVALSVGMEAIQRATLRPWRLS